MNDSQLRSLADFLSVHPEFQVMAAMVSLFFVWALNFSKFVAHELSVWASVAYQQRSTK